MKPLLIFDGDCGFCRKWIARWRSWTGDRVDYAPYQETASRFPQIKAENFANAVHLVEEGGQVSKGAKAVFRTLAYAPGKRWLFWIYDKIPGAAWVAELFYSLVSRNRMAFSWATYLLWGESLEPPTYYLARWVFLRALGVAYLTAFLSIWVQIQGLIGSNGLLPAQRYLEAVSSVAGARGVYLVPSLAWLSSSDFFLHAMCLAGVALSILLIVGLAPALSCLGLWALYLSLTSVGQDFFSFQWDILLLEAGFLAIFLSPWRLRPRLKSEPPPSGAVVLLIKLLLFKLLLSSGLVKLMSGDPSWKNLTALSYHYETQPLPTWIGWYAHQLPQWAQTVSTVAMFAVELIVPFLIFLPRRLNILAFGAIGGLQVAIAFTGNYTYFNWLTLALAAFLLDDEVLRGLLPARVVVRLNEARARAQEPRLKKFFVGLVAVAAVCSTWYALGRTIDTRRFVPDFASEISGALGPLRTFNHYGLFAVMTTVRKEIVIEGSDDGARWQEYEFKWKPGDLKKAPGFVAPHQPRLDWQMWFAVFRSYDQNVWFQSLLMHLLKGTPEVLALLEKNPFPARPPKYIRSQLYRYSFTNLDERRKDGSWWKREALGAYSPPMSLKDARGGNPPSSN